MTTYTISYLNGTKKILCGKHSTANLKDSASILSYHINYGRGVACESGKHK